MDIEQLYRIYLRHPSVQTDSRKLKKGDLFFALKGPNFNGNRYAALALEQGAAYAIVDEGAVDADRGTHETPGETLPSAPSDRIIVVDDVLHTLQDLALHHRQQFTIPFIAITGSNGKTTTKELIHAVLSSVYKVYTTAGNLNNHIGVPLTLLSIATDAQFAVIEMGANHREEIADYCRYTLPTHGLITNAGLAHLEGFGGPEGVKKGKGELFDFLRDGRPAAGGEAETIRGGTTTGDSAKALAGVAGTSGGTATGGSAETFAGGGTAFVMWDYDYLREMSRGIPHIVTYGTTNADYCGVAGQNGPFLSVRFTRGTTIGLIHTQLVGDYNLPNVLAAVAIGKHFGVPEAQIRGAIADYAPSNSRSQLIEQGGNQFILDAYNANPSSMQAAIENFAWIGIAGGGAMGNGPLSGGAAGSGADARTGKEGAAGEGKGGTGTGGKILILGAMAELGEGSLEEHRKIVALIGQYSWRQVVLVGGDFLRISHPWLSFGHAAEAGQWLRNAGLKDTYILIKGSRSMKMEEVLER